jgi:phage host-nuclease inhibitor protein Gam
MNAFGNSVVSNTAQTIAKIRNQYIENVGLETEVYTNYQEKDLTEFGEVSYFTTRTPKIIKFLPALKTKYSLQPMGRAGIVNELVGKSVFNGFIKTTEELNKGDLIKLTYSYADGTVNIKFYIVKNVEVYSVISSIGKKVTFTTYFLPVSYQEISNYPENYLNSQPGLINKQDFI